ncbi:MAG: adenosylcobalamin-dependent ribonucleoside-diphosphate reductase, partial [Patescibacteria group bacterium]
FGDQQKSQRENSIKQLIERVAKTMALWGLKQKYFSTEEEANAFREEIAFLSLDQKMAFNSPVWFNVGTHIYENPNRKIEQKEAYVVDDGKIIKIPLGKDREYPQTSACFIQEVQDNMESIMELAKREALLFKYGSGTGTNLSTLRSSREKLSGGGRPSGPMAYWSFYDKVAGIVKSGGKTRRAAKMDILNISHPDILEFINSKMHEEKKLHILIDNGIDWKDAVESCNYQNTNISIRVSDKFMKAVLNDEEWQTVPVLCHDLAKEMPKYRAKELLKKISEGTHFCGDPGMQFDDTINKWHTCSNSARINASNPCSEFVFVDNSSCNLASLNLMKFLNKNGDFNFEDFSNAVKTTAIAQDLEIDNSSYPTKEIAENSHKFRPLGMGYANLGSLLMFLGLPYDSDEARNAAASITALLTGKVYETSTEMAEKIGVFEEFEKNKEPMLNVIRMHKEALKNISREKLPKYFIPVLEEAEKTWNVVLERGEKFGFRNAQATVLAPTGTIGFMMDCDTKGIEPEIGLVQVKLLSDGGILKLVNGTVKISLDRLGY